MNFEFQVTTKFEPKPDITAYELAILLPYVLGQPLYRKTLDAMPPEIRRHVFEAKKDAA